jgi:hypothetical protein
MRFPSSVSRRHFLRSTLAGGALAWWNSFALADAPAAGAVPTTAVVTTPPLDYPALLEKAPVAATRYDGTVAVWFSSHYQIDDRDWVNIKEFGNDYHPLEGYYKSDDPAVLKKQLHWMRRAGIDAIVYDVFSTGAWRLTDLPKDKTLPLLLQELANQQNESRKLKLIIWFERYWGAPTVEEYKYAFDYIKQYLAPKDFYFRYKGKPLVVPFLNTKIDEIDEVMEKYRDDFEIRYIRPYHSDVWSYIDHYPQQKRKGWMCASPGFDAYLENAHISRHVNHQTEPSLDKIRADAPREARAGGAAYIKQLTWAKQCNPDIIFVSGWNDWQYGCQIEPSEEYRFFYLDLTSKVLGRWAETAPYRDEA